MDETGISTTTNKPSPAFLKSAVAQNAVQGFERPGIWPVNKYVFGDEDYEPAAVIAGTSNMNIGPEIDPLSEIFSSRNRTPSCKFQDSVASIVNTPEKISSQESELGCSRIVSAVGPDIAAQRGDTVVPDTEENTRRDNSPDSKPDCLAYSRLVLRPIANPAKPMTTRKRKLQKSEILLSTPIKEDQKQKYEKNKVKSVIKTLNDKFKNVPKKTNIKTDKDQKTAKKVKQQKKKKIYLMLYCGEMYRYSRRL
ncbi:hypothetical protein HHI36_002324 [Cryptolaemus montrouzieri]|uniref:Uncharacterized protein n=1 Tax=Cryptolaemus montrouzieri TaxID=559131 RepID=A0ABD2PAR1_9CUCU